MEIKTKINKWNLIILTSFCTTKETIKRIKRQLSEWEKIMANETDKGLISKIYKQLIRVNTRKTNNQKVEKRPKQTFVQRWHTESIHIDDIHEKMLNIARYSVQFSGSVMSDSATPWTAACQASLSITNSQGLLKLMSIESVMLSSHHIICCPLLLLPPIPPIIRVFSNESVLCIR